MRNSSKVGAFLLFVFFFAYLGFWLALNLLFPEDSPFFDYFTDSYGISAAIGGIFGYIASQKWGGFKSIMGKSLMFFSAGLFFQFLGQVTYAIYYYVFNIENAYPSIGDFFYFGSIPFYITAIFFLFKVLKLEVGIHNNLKRAAAVLIPLIFVSAAYYKFLIDYEFDPEALLTTLLDFGYPLGDALLLGLTAIAFLFSTSTLGGKLKKHIIFLFLALIMQYFADTVYLIHTIGETWRPGGLDDLFYLSTYVVMGLTLISFGHAVEDLLSPSGADNSNNFNG